MSYAQYIREIGRGAEGARDLSSDDARQLYAAMLDGGVPDLELGASDREAIRSAFAAMPHRISE